MTVGVHDNCYTCGNACPANPRDKSGSLRSWPADTNGIGFPGNTPVANFDIVAAGS
jgi:hypothetical protein